MTELHRLTFPHWKMFNCDCKYGSLQNFMVDARCLPLQMCWRFQVSREHLYVSLLYTGLRLASKEAVKSQNLLVGTRVKLRLKHWPVSVFSRMSVLKVLVIQDHPSRVLHYTITKCFTMKTEHVFSNKSNEMVKWG